MFDYLPLGIVNDKNMRYMQKRVWLRPIDFVQAQTSGASVLLNTDSAGSVGTLAVAVTNFAWVKFTATTENTDTLWRVPYDFDNRHPLRFRFYWTSGYTGANGTATFKILYNGLLPNVAPIVGATALTSALTASTKTSATANVPYWTGYGILAPLSTGALAYQTLDDRTEFLALRISIGAVTGLTLASDFVYMLGMEIAYTPKMMFGDGSQKEAYWPESNLSQVAADPAVQTQ